MRYFKNVPRTILASIVFVMLSSFTFQADLQFPISAESFNIEMNEAKANGEGDIYEDAELAYQTCWVTGRQFLKCVHGDYVCDVSDQGYCGGSD